MKIKQGYSYHIKDEFFDMVQDKYLMSNKENGNYRPHFYAVQDKKDSGLYWMIPISSQVEKYKGIIEKKKKKYGKCNTIVIGKFAGKENALTLYAQWEDAKPKKAGAPALKSKKNRQLIVSFKKVTGADGYEIAYSQKKKCPSSSAKKVTTELTKKTLKNLKTGKKYYVKLRAYRIDSTGKKTYGAYSKVKSIKVK